MHALIFPVTIEKLRRKLRDTKSFVNFSGALALKITVLGAETWYKCKLRYDFEITHYKLITLVDSITGQTSPDLKITLRNCLDNLSEQIKVCLDIDL